MGNPGGGGEPLAGAAGVHKGWGALCGSCLFSFRTRAFADFWVGNDMKWCVLERSLRTTAKGEEGVAVGMERQEGWVRQEGKHAGGRRGRLVVGLVLV